MLFIVVVDFKKYVKDKFLTSVLIIAIAPVKKGAAMSPNDQACDLGVHVLLDVFKVCFISLILIYCSKA